MKRPLVVTKLLAVSIFAILLASSVHANPTSIRGRDSSYVGSELVLYTYFDQITYSEKELARCKVAPDGSFQFDFNSAETQFVFLHLGVYKLYMFAQADTSYEIKMPRKMAKRTEDQLNPYFKEIQVQAGIVHASPYELNFLIRSFDNTFNAFFNKFVVQSFDKGKLKELDVAIAKIDEPYSAIKNQFFSDYRKYKYATLRYMAAQKKSKSISDNFFLNQPVLYSNVAYMELFNQTYDKYFSFFGRTEKGKKIYDDINRDKSLLALEATLSIDNVLSNDTLKEMVMLKNLHDAYYGADFSRAGIVQILDSIIFTTKIQSHKTLAASIRRKITLLQKGFEPPSFELFNKDSVLIKLSDFKGKYVYLGFCACLSYSCIKEFAALKQLKLKFGNKLEIVTISVDDNLKAMRDYLKTSGYDWTFLHYGNQPDILKDYDIRGFPTYFVIGKDGKLCLSPAASPAENIEMGLFQLMRSNNDL
jgi:peroxiredoxin